MQSDSVRSTSVADHVNFLTMVQLMFSLYLNCTALLHHYLYWRTNPYGASCQCDSPLKVPLLYQPSIAQIAVEIRSVQINAARVLAHQPVSAKERLQIVKELGRVCLSQGVITSGWKSNMTCCYIIYTFCVHSHELVYFFVCCSHHHTKRNNHRLGLVVQGSLCSSDVQLSLKVQVMAT